MSDFQDVFDELMGELDYAMPQSAGPPGLRGQATGQAAGLRPVGSRQASVRAGSLRPRIL